ncbi:hypothetical protein, partial [Campylobacter rectus]|uniref:hypothetical protein n=1 Tax=Campylobacter rectus TaxID=203 RepID=UPI001E651059
SLRSRNPHLPHCTLEVAARKFKFIGPITPKFANLISSNLTFSRCVSQRIKFANSPSNLNAKR